MEKSTTKMKEKAMVVMKLLMLVHMMGIGGEDSSMGLEDFGTKTNFSNMRVNGNVENRTDMGKYTINGES